MTTRAHTQPRRDALPEFFEYRDTGCSVAPSCLACPLPVCRYELGGRGNAREARALLRDPEIRAAAAAGEEAATIAARFAISERRVYAIAAGLFPRGVHRADR